MSNAIDETLGEVLNEMPGRVSNRLLLGVLIETRYQLNQKVDDLERRLAQVENSRSPWHFERQPVQIVKLILLVIFLAGATNITETIDLIRALALFLGG